MLLDSSVIVEIFRSPSSSKHFKAIMKEIGDEEAFVSIVQLAEIADWAVRNQVPPKDRVTAIKDFARIVPLDEQICLDASTAKHRRREQSYIDFSLLDAIILATARSIGQRVLTFDKDFTRENDCTVLS
jgi:predicted nucleic acid-binding protein